MSQDVPIGATQVSLAQLNERSRDIFRQIVESYLATGEPAGRHHRARAEVAVRLAPYPSLRVGDRVYLRHAKAGELCEHFNSLYLVDGERIIDEVPTYRGEGKTFARYGATLAETMTVERMSQDGIAVAEYLHKTKFDPATLPALLKVIDRKEIEEMEPSKLSPMPVGLLNLLTKDEILDLEETDSEEIYKDLDTVDDKVEEAAFQDFGCLFDSFV